MSDDIGWRFPPTNGGRIDGFNDPGIAHFTGAPLASLARETIQNSLDARLAPDEPVHVSFELIYLRPGDIGQDELAMAINASIQTVGDDPLASAALATAKSILSDKIPCLRVSDRNTTGLLGAHWRALVKMQGVSHKPESKGAGGSHGIGKYAPFAVSTLRTVRAIRIQRFPRLQLLNAPRNGRTRHPGRPCDQCNTAMPQRQSLGGGPQSPRPLRQRRGEDLELALQGLDVHTSRVQLYS